MELQRQRLVHRRADKRLEVLFVVGVDRGLVIVVALVLLGVAPRVLRREALGALDERLEVLLGLRVAPVRQPDVYQQRRSADHHRAGAEHGHTLQQADRERAAEARDQADRAEATVNAASAENRIRRGVGGVPDIVLSRLAKIEIRLRDRVKIGQS